MDNSSWWVLTHNMYLACTTTCIMIMWQQSYSIHKNWSWPTSHLCIYTLAVSKYTPLCMPILRGEVHVPHFRTNRLETTTVTVILLQALLTMVRLPPQAHAHYEVQGLNVYSNRMGRVLTFDWLRMQMLAFTGEQNTTTINSTQNMDWPPPWLGLQAAN